MKKNIALFTISVFILNIFLPAQVNAQYYRYTREGESPVSSGEVRQWRYRSSDISNKINNLDNDRAMEVPMPILFGLTPDNLTKNFGDPRSGGRTHEGLDIMAPKRALIVTPTDAVVIRVGVGDSAGNYVYTANPGGETFAYMHLDEIANIEEGDELSKGELIGYVGNTGNASGGATHLHFEIHYDNEPEDPFPRLTRIFPLVDKIRYLKVILNNADSEKRLSEDLVALYRKEFVLAQSLNITLPDAITNALTVKVTTEALSIARTLKIGMTGDDVKLLQTSLGVVADGSFGPKTKAALIDFQISKGLTPDGVFGPKTRLLLGGGDKTGCTSTTIYSPVTGVKC